MVMFFITCASGFEKEAKKEVLGLLEHNAKVTTLFMKGLLVLESEREDAPQILEAAANTVYLSHIYPVQQKLEITKSKDTTEKIAEAVETINDISKSETFAIYCERRGMHDFSSRDVISAVADRIDSKVDLDKPDKTVVIQIVQDVCFVGICKSKDLIVKVITAGNKYEERPLNRAEFKLREALEEFDIELMPEWRALDIGASPGGWTKVLAEQVKEVIAVDPGELAEEVKALKNVKHIKKRIEKAGNIGKFDIVVNDMNLEPAESAHIMCDLAKLLKGHSFAIMTIKFVTRNRNKHIEDATGILSKCYEIKAIQRMQHNKFETTIFMVKRGN